MKAILVDIDGVLNCERTPNPRGLPYVVDQKLLFRFCKLVRESGARVVLTSSWRIDPIGLYAAKFYKIPYHDICPDMPQSPRGSEIRCWLKEHPKCRRFVVIDDEDDDLDDLPLFQPSSHTGLSREICRGVLAYLSGSTDEDMRAGVVTGVFENVAGAFHRNKD